VTDECGVQQVKRCDWEYKKMMTNYPALKTSIFVCGRISPSRGRKRGAGPSAGLIIPDQGPSCSYPQFVNNRLSYMSLQISNSSNYLPRNASKCKIVLKF